MPGAALLVEDGWVCCVANVHRLGGLERLALERFRDLLEGVPPGLDDEEVEEEEGDDEDGEVEGVPLPANGLHYNEADVSPTIDKEVEKTIRTRYWVRVRGEHTRALVRDSPGHHTLSTHRVRQNLGRVREEDGTASDEEESVVQPDEGDGGDTSVGVARLGVHRSGDGETDVGADDTRPGDEDLGTTVHVLSEPKRKDTDKTSELRGEEVR